MNWAPIKELITPPRNRHRNLQRQNTENRYHKSNSNHPTPEPLGPHFCCRCRKPSHTSECAWGMSLRWLIAETAGCSNACVFYHRCCSSSACESDWGWRSTCDGIMSSIGYGDQGCAGAGALAKSLYRRADTDVVAYRYRNLCITLAKTFGYFQVSRLIT